MFCSTNGFDWRPFSEIQWMAVKKDVSLSKEKLMDRRTFLISFQHPSRHPTSTKYLSFWPKPLPCRGSNRKQTGRFRC